MRTFLWKGNSAVGYPKVAWNVVCKPIEEGGQGIRDILALNKALMSRHLWNVIQNNQSSIWVKWIAHTRLRHKSVWTVDVKGGSWGWRKILRLRSALLPYIEFKIGDGESFSLWHDPWHSLGSLITRFPRGPGRTNIPEAAKLSAVLVMEIGVGLLTRIWNVLKFYTCYRLFTMAATLFYGEVAVFLQRLSMILSDPEVGLTHTTPKTHTSSTNSIAPAAMEDEGEEGELGKDSHGAVLAAPAMLPSAEGVLTMEKLNADFNLKEFFELASRVIDEGDSESMEMLKALKQQWKEKLGGEFSTAGHGGFRPVQARQLTPFPAKKSRPARRCINGAALTTGASCNEVPKSNTAHGTSQGLLTAATSAEAALTPGASCNEAPNFIMAHGTSNRPLVAANSAAAALTKGAACNEAPQSFIMHGASQWPGWRRLRLPRPWMPKNHRRLRTPCDAIDGHLH
ncbi:UNVERIFIED_CONTAM: putative ribonuclease H protein [Sesamum calycinum]|uniref:Ribonuclease H protein n=1 Tax=Sesamum calycinum TaxID=2727403 RepID=A0AAW2JGN4_9LAMI